MATTLRVKEKSQWKHLKLPEDVLNSEDFSALVEIQELIDYELVPVEGDASDSETRRKNKANSRKRKCQDETKMCDEQELGKDSPRKKKKTSKKKHEENKLSVKNEDSQLSLKSMGNKTKNKSNFKQKDEHVEKSNCLLKKKDLAHSKKQSSWMVSSKNVEIVTGEDIHDENLDKSISNTEKVPNRGELKLKKANKAQNKGTESLTGSVFNVTREDTLNENMVNSIISGDEICPSDQIKLKKTRRKKNIIAENEVKTAPVDDHTEIRSSKINKILKTKRKKKNKSKKMKHLSQEAQTTIECDVLEGQEAESSYASSKVDMSEWNDLFVPDELLKALQDLKFTKPTVIQRQSLPSAIRDRKDILGAAETGSGKTLAFGIPLISHILNAKRVAGHYYDREEKNEDDYSDDSTEKDSLPIDTLKNPPMALILEPTRELAVQVQKHLKAVAKYTDIKFANIVGGMSVEKQRRILGKNPEVIIATPGRLWQLIEEGNDHLCQIDCILCLVLDEADRMVEKGHYEELTKLLELINKSRRKTKSRQTFVMSATLTMDISAPKRLMNKGKKVHKEEDKIKSLIEKTCIRGKPQVIDLTPSVKVAQTLTELRINCKADEKDFFLYYFLCQHPGRTLVFANSKDCLRRLVAVFTLLQCSPLPLHADMHQRQRLKNLDRFSENKRALLIASDVAARGLDIPHVDHVIHYQVPRTMENYVHRSGRTARASNLGLSVMLVGPEDAKDYRKIIQGVRNGEDLPLLPVEMELMPAVRQRVNLARELGVKEYRIKKKKVKNNFFIKAAEEMDMIIDDDRLLEDLGDHVEQAQEKQQLMQMKARLSQVLKGSLAPLRMTKYPTKSGQLATKNVINLLAR